ncbi:DUF2637 domain-containing protein [Streptomyces sp. NPDC059373]
MTTTAIPAARMSAWDRAAITVLGSAGCALSYDALQQMAVAIHVRGILTYLFPLVIDGFIAYGVRALIILRAAPFHARLYVWTLFGTATAASIWANALHAIRINQQTATASGVLRLGDFTVGALSTIAPLALAGAVHLYILITRHAAGTDHPHPPTCGTGPDRGAPADAEPATFTESTAPAQGDALDDSEPADAAPEDIQPPTRRMGRPPSAEIDELVAIARPTVTAMGTVSRKAVLESIRNAGHTISHERLKEVIRSLETEATTDTATVGNSL